MENANKEFWERNKEEKEGEFHTTFQIISSKKGNKINKENK